jgi:hypothetical protein
LVVVVALVVDVAFVVEVAVLVVVVPLFRLDVVVVLGASGIVRNGADAVADLLTIRGNGAIAAGMRCALGRK